MENKDYPFKDGAFKNRSLENLLKKTSTTQESKKYIITEEQLENIINTNFGDADWNTTQTTSGVYSDMTTKLKEYKEPKNDYLEDNPENYARLEGDRYIFGLPKQNLSRAAKYEIDGLKKRVKELESNLKCLDDFLERLFTMDFVDYRILTQYEAYRELKCLKKQTIK